MRENRKHQTSMLCSSHDEEFNKRETEFLGYQATGNQKTLKVGIFSPDRFIRDFLQGILTFQGYQCIDAQEGQDYDREKLTWLWDVTTHADKSIIERNQQGVNSRYYVPGPLSEMENYTWKFLSWYLRTMQGKLRVAA